MGMISESSRLSLTTAGSSIKTAFGAVSATGVGTPEFEVTHKGAGPTAFIAAQPAGTTGGVRLSKFSLNGKQGPNRRTVAIASPVPAPATQPASCTKPVAGLGNVNTALPEGSVVAVPCR